MTLEHSDFESPGICPQCSTQIAPTMLACPRCGNLVYSQQLQALADTARAATEQGDIPAALVAWREALELLPDESRQFQAISSRISDLTRNAPVDARNGSQPRSPARRGKSKASSAAAGLSAIGLLFWKLKVLLLGLTKASTFLSMLLSLGVYWAVWGWKFALGLVLSIYVHEMGHVIALRRLGFKAGLPVFIPGLGALIRLRQQVNDPHEDAVIGLAGPIYGLGAAIASAVLWYATKNPMFAVIAAVGAWINLFNLVPILPLDGGRGFHAMSRLQRLIATAAMAGAWWYSPENFHGLFNGAVMTHAYWDHWWDTQEGLLGLLTLVCLGRTLADTSERKGDWKATVQYAALVAALTFLSTVMRPHGMLK